MNKPNFLGKGWAFPPAFIKGAPGVVAMTYADENIKENLRILLMTRIGERICELGYGTRLKKLAFAGINARLVGNIKETIKRGILLYERRIQLENIKVDLSQSREGYVLIDIHYTINQTNDRSNFVYPFHFTEGTNINL